MADVYLVGLVVVRFRRCSSVSSMSYGCSRHSLPAQWSHASRIWAKTCPVGVDTLAVGSDIDTMSIQPVTEEHYLTRKLRVPFRRVSASGRRS